MGQSSGKHCNCQLDTVPPEDVQKSESLVKRERDEALVDAVLNRDNADSAAPAVSDFIEQRRRSRQEYEDVVRRDSGGGHVQVVGDHYDLDDVDSMMVSDAQKALLRMCWRSIQKNLESVGVVTFLKLFETHPETLKPFIPDVKSLREIELNEWYQENLKVHSIRVMAVIEKMLHRLDDPRRAALILVEYGRRHFGYGVTEMMLEYMAESFILAIQPSLEESWTPEVEESWQTLFRFVIVFMKVGHRDRAKTEAESAAANGEGGGHEKKKKKKQRSKKGKNQEAKAEPPSGSEVSSGATAVKDEGENRIACKECGRLRLECVVVENS